MAISVILELSCLLIMVDMAEDTITMMKGSCEVPQFYPSVFK